MAKRVFLIVLDSAGIGYEPDADKFGDVGADTFGTCYRSGDLNVPHFLKMGLFNIDGTSFRNPISAPIGAYGRFRERSNGKDTTVGHWEIAGMVSEAPLPTFPEGFPEEVIREFENLTGRKALCNLPYSGTEVIKDYGKEACETGALIVYTSADSVFQIAAHEDVVPIGELYDICRKARAMLVGKYGVGRVIARPFTGEWPYERTVRRHDFSLEPPKETVLDALKAAGYDVLGVGKINDIFAGKGVTESWPNEGNVKNMERTISLADRDFNGLCFVNLVDTDALYGHRRDIYGYTQALNKADEQIGELMCKLRPEDILIVTADHGCDPGFKGTDHTREYIPVLIFGETVRKNTNLGTRPCFSDLAATIADYFKLDYRGDGESAGERLWNTKEC